MHFYRNIVIDNLVQYEYYRFKRNNSPILLDIVEIQENRKLITIAVRLKYLLQVTVPEGSYTFKADLIDVSISTDKPGIEVSESDVREMKKCGNDLVDALEYEPMSTDAIFTSIKKAIISH